MSWPCVHSSLQKSSQNECDDDDEDCELLNGGSGEDTFNERRAYSPQKQQVKFCKSCLFFFLEAFYCLESMYCK